MCLRTQVTVNPFFLIWCKWRWQQAQQWVLCLYSPSLVLLVPWCLHQCSKREIEDAAQSDCTALLLNFSLHFCWNAGRVLWLRGEASHAHEPSFIFQTQKATKNCHLFPAGFVRDRIILRGVGRSANVGYSNSYTTRLEYLKVSLLKYFLLM